MYSYKIRYLLKQQNDGIKELRGKLRIVDLIIET